MIGFKGFGFGRKARQFEYIPRHYDPEAEERELRRKAALGEDYKEGDPNYVPGMLIRQAQLRRMRTSRRIHKKSKNTLNKVILFLVLLVIVFYLMSDKIAEFILSIR